MTIQRDESHTMILCMNEWRVSKKDENIKRKKNYGKKKWSWRELFFFSFVWFFFCLFFIIIFFLVGGRVWVVSLKKKMIIKIYKKNQDRKMMTVNVTRIFFSFFLYLSFWCWIIFCFTLYILHSCCFICPFVWKHIDEKWWHIFPSFLPAAYSPRLLTYAPTSPYFSFIFLFNLMTV